MREMPLEPDEIERERAYWRHVPRTRPTRIEIPGPGQESVWDYPRPPRIEPVRTCIRVEYAGILLARSFCAIRVVETASPPAYYLPPQHVRSEFLVGGGDSALCEWKGVAQYRSVRVGDRLAQDAVWTYPEPDPAFAQLRGYLAFNASRLDACYVGPWRVTPQPGPYYGGWITPDIVGPFKGIAGSESW